MRMTCFYSLYNGSMVFLLEFQNNALNSAPHSGSIYMPGRVPHFAFCLCLSVCLFILFLSSPKNTNSDTTPQQTQQLTLYHIFSFNEGGFCLQAYPHVRVSRYAIQGNSTDTTNTQNISVHVSSLTVMCRFLRFVVEKNVMFRENLRC